MDTLAEFKIRMDVHGQIVKYLPFTRCLNLRSAILLGSRAFLILKWTSFV